MSESDVNFRSKIFHNFIRFVCIRKYYITYPSLIPNEVKVWKLSEMSKMIQLYFQKYLQNHYTRPAEAKKYIHLFM